MIPVDGFICFQSYSCICEYSDELYYVKALHHLYVLACSHLYVLACSSCTVPMTILVSDWTETSQLWPSIMCRCLVFVHILCQFFRSLSTNISTTLIFQTLTLSRLWSAIYCCQFCSSVAIELFWCYITSSFFLTRILIHLFDELLWYIQWC